MLDDDVYPISGDVFCRSVFRMVQRVFESELLTPIA